MAIKNMENNKNNATMFVLVISILTSVIFGSIFGFGAGIMAIRSGNDLPFIRNIIEQNIVDNINSGGQRVVTIDQESAVIKAVEEVSPSVVSIIVTKDLPIMERNFNNPRGSEFFRQFFGDEFGDFFGVPQQQQQGTVRREIGGGTGFIVSNDGYVLTNKHVVADEAADYTVLMNDGKKIEAKVLARDPLIDLAVLKIEGNDFKALQFGDSSNLKAGQTVIAIGNSLGEFRNTVSTGVISGLSRSVLATGIGFGTEQLTGVIQTDASINPGNSGGPLLNISGQVIGINTAMAQGAENIGFAIPINEIKSIYESVKTSGRIIRPWLGVRHAIINKEITASNKLSVDYGALIIRGENRTDLAVIPGSPADKAGLVENDIILEVNGEKITEDNQLAKLIGKYKVGDEVTLKVLSKDEQKDVKVRLEEMK